MKFTESIDGVDRTTMKISIRLSIDDVDALLKYFGSKDKLRDAFEAALYDAKGDFMELAGNG